MRLCFGCRGLGPNIFGWFRYLLPYNKLFHKAGCVHDDLYSINHDKEKSDKLFLRMCLAVSKTNTQRAFARLYYDLVKKFGFIFYNSLQN